MGSVMWFAADTAVVAAAAAVSRVRFTGAAVVMLYVTRLQRLAVVIVASGLVVVFVVHVLVLVFLVAVECRR